MNLPKFALDPPPSTLPLIGICFSICFVSAYLVTHLDTLFGTAPTLLIALFLLAGITGFVGSLAYLFFQLHHKL